MTVPDSAARTLQSLGRASADDALGREIARLAPWFHNLHLPSGHQTAPDHPLGDFPAFKWQQIAPSLPTDLTGWRALDIGCNAGFYAFELARRGAHVLGVDHDEHYLAQARWAADRLGLADRVRWRRMGVYDLVDLGESFDLVLFLGVLYHLRYPLLGLDIVGRLVGGTLILQTLTSPASGEVRVPTNLPLDGREAMLDPAWPSMAFIEHELAGDPTNWWALNDAGVRALIRSCGLEVRSSPGHEIYVCARAQGPHRHEAELRAATGRAGGRSEAESWHGTVRGRPSM